MWRKEAKTEEEEMHFQILRSYPLCDFSLLNALKCESAARLSSRPVIFFNRWWRFSINFPDTSTPPRRRAQRLTRKTNDLMSFRVQS